MGAWEESLLAEGGRIVLVVLDGVGDIRAEEFGWRTPLEAARTPNLDSLARRSVTGRLVPVAPGVTPGSVTGHLALFGYDPETARVGRGVADALGAGVELQPGDVVARANLAVVDGGGVVRDRRAGRPPTEVTVELCRRINAATGGEIGGVAVEAVPIRQHRVAVLFRGEGLSPEVTDSDPQRVGAPVEAIRPRAAAAQRLAAVAERFRLLAADVLRENGSPANHLLLRGFARRPELTPFRERYGLRGAAAAVYPTYRGIGRVCGLDVVGNPESPAETVAAYRRHRADYDFFFLHFKDTDSSGEDGDFDRKVRAIEEFDALLPLLLEDGADVLAITADHSTPVALRSHSWHPVPLLVAARAAGRDDSERFTEAECARGSLGLGRAVDLMPVLLANAGRLKKFGA